MIRRTLEVIQRLTLLMPPRMPGGQRVVLFPPDKQTLVCPSITYDKKRDETTMIIGKYLLDDDDEYELKINEDSTFDAYGESELGFHGPEQRGVFTASLPGPGVNPLVNYNILCDGASLHCPKESYQGNIIA